jgi:hypothetical protein
MEEEVEKTHHVFITVEDDELIKIVNNYLKNKGALKNIPSVAECVPFDQDYEVCLEYQWSEK